MGFWGKTYQREIQKDGKKYIQTFIKHYSPPGLFLEEYDKKKYSKTHSSDKDVLLDEREI